MLEYILKLLKADKDIDGWKLVEDVISDREAFYIKDELQMNRKKKVTNWVITVYKENVTDNEKFLGSATTSISPNDSRDIIKDKIKSLGFNASLIQNPYYELPEKSDEKLPVLEKTIEIDKKDTDQIFQNIIHTVYDKNTYENGGINSCEFFYEEKHHRILNSNGIDEAYKAYNGQIELVVDWKEETEEVEVFTIYNFADFDKEELEKMVDETFEKAKGRAIAKKNFKVEKCPVILTGEAVNTFFSYFINQAYAEMVYKKTTVITKEDTLSEEPFTIELLPEMNNSPYSKYIDEDGVILKPVTIYKEGKLVNLFGDSRHCQYIDEKVTGKIPNRSIYGGTKEKEELYKGDYLEVLWFSQFQLSPMTGEFGGEIRLAEYYHDGKLTKITGGSVTGNIAEVMKNMQISKETAYLDNYKSPIALKLFDAHYSGE